MLVRILVHPPYHLEAVHLVPFHLVPYHLEAVRLVPFHLVPCHLEAVRLVPFHLVPCHLEAVRLVRRPYHLEAVHLHLEAGLLGHQLNLPAAAAAVHQHLVPFPEQEAYLNQNQSMVRQDIHLNEYP